MMHHEDPPSKEQSFQIIERMIAAARNEHTERGEGWLLWGWLLFGASLASIILSLLNFSLDGKIYSGAYILELVNDHDRSTVKFIKR